MPEVVFKTSGSTGEAKCIARREASLMEDARRLVAAFPEIWRSRPTVVATVRPEHMYGALWRVRAPMCAGASVDERVIISVEELLEAKTRYGAFVLVTTPSFLEKAIEHPDFTQLGGSILAIVTSGSPLRGKTALAAENAVGVCPLEIYGSTEAGTVAWRRRVGGEEWTLTDGVCGSMADDGRLVVDSELAMTRPCVMDDIVEFVGERKFLLKGRADRRVKILESYVSIRQVEETLLAHSFVDRARVQPYGDGVPRLGALVTLSKEGVAALKSCSALAAEWRSFLVDRVEPLAVPRRFRVVRTLPVNEQGKTTAAAVADALDAWCREPIVVSWQATAQSLDAELFFADDMECFTGHFPDFPILPGVAQLYFLRHFACQVFPDWPEIATYRKLKFQKLVLPNSIVAIKINRLGENSYGFRFESQGGLCASGSVERCVS